MRRAANTSAAFSTVCRIVGMCVCGVLMLVAVSCTESKDKANRPPRNLRLYKRGERYGYITDDGEPVVRPQFLRAGEFSEGLAPVLVGAKLDPGGLLEAGHIEGGQWGYIDGYGEMAIPARFLSADSFTSGVAIVGASTAIGTFGYGLIDKTGAFLAVPNYLNIRPFQNGMALAVGRAADVSGGKPQFGYINMRGEEVVPTQYEDGFDFRGDYGLVKKGGRWTRVNKTGAVENDTTQAVEFLIEVLEGKDEDMQGKAAQTLGEIGPEARAAVPALKKLRTSDRWAHWYGGNHNVQLGQEAERARLRIECDTPERLRNAAGADDPLTRRLAITALCQERLKDDPTVALFITALNDSDRMVRFTAIWALSKQAVGRKDAMQALIRNINHSDTMTGERIIETLGKMGPAAREAVPALRKVVEEDGDNRFDASRALDFIEERMPLRTPLFPGPLDE